MPKNSEEPRKFDAVKGGQVPPPVSGAVLGGIEGLRQRFATGNEQVRLDAVTNASIYGDEALDILVKALKDASLQVRVKAYQILKELNQAESETAKGIRLNIGDKIYCVYLSSLSYGDDGYYVRDAIDDIDDEDEDYDEYEERSEKNLLYKPQLDDGEGYAHYIAALKYNEKSITEEDYRPVVISPHIFREEAEEAAEILHRKRLLQVYYEYGMIYEQNYYDKDQLNQWCKENNLSIACKRNEESEKFQVRIYRTLQDKLNIELLKKFWEYTVSGHLAFVHECIIDRKCYLRPNHNF
ncbi:hypothetical protein DSM106972_088860 [Dulcicalothrix desertica PCC 7102]|uniref:Uncharacterized protein n=1 Tax=Dulcicalothrix desertica PCC 7102 TaxID=232991 RepID=A0A3S1AN13_9CYAN|nr:hypothetical protein [Dulcicalothrix desertica]RUS95873.1 hypothetical protein DSM106972_088860 [Dulcicalothrix desertica PCC 7102]TWH39509.1 hypothetical protein CAL7102_08750 [Dulcicalothrix desertica PCC 7102]